MGRPRLDAAAYSMPVALEVASCSCCAFTLLALPGDAFPTLDGGVDATVVAAVAGFSG